MFACGIAIAIKQAERTFLFPQERYFNERGNLKAMKKLNKILLMCTMVIGLSMAIAAQKNDDQKKPPPKNPPPVVNPQPKPPPRENQPPKKPGTEFALYMIIGDSRDS